MNILTITHTDYPSYEGLRERIHNFAKELSILGHKMTVLAPQFEGNKPKFEKNDYYDIFRINLSFLKFLDRNPVSFRIFICIAYPLFIIAHCYSFLRNKQIQIIQAEQLFSLPAALFLRYLLKTELILDDVTAVESMLIKLGKINLAKFVKKLETFLFSKCDAFVYTSALSKRYLESRLVKEKMLLIPNGVDTTKFSPSKTKLKIKNKYQLFFNCSLYAQQNVRAILNMIKISQDLYQGCSVPFETQIICGPLDRLPRQCIDSEPVKTGLVKVKGSVKDIVGYITDSDITLLPYDQHIEGGNRLKALEYLSCEKIVVTTPEGIEGIDGLEDGKHIIIVESIENMAIKLKEILENFEDYAEMGKNAREFVESNYNWGRLVAKYANL